MKYLDSNCPSFVATLLDEACERNSKAVFMIQNDTVLTFGGMRRYVDTWAIDLLHVGVRAGDRVVIVNHDPLQTVCALFAISRVGAVFCIVDERISVRNLQHVFDDCKPFIVLTKQLPPRLTGYGYKQLSSGLEAFLRINADEARMTQASNFAAIIYTSGSTGYPKGVALTSANIMFSVTAIQECLCYRQEDIVAVYLPLSFDYALYQIFLACRAGCTLILRKMAPTSALIISALQRDQVTIFPSVPSLTVALTTALRRNNATQALNHLLKLTSTGQLFPPALYDELQSLLPQLHIYPMYGLTECKRISILLPQEHSERRGSVGRPLPGTLVNVISEEGEQLLPGQLGQFVVEGDHVATYWPGGQDEVFKTCQGRRLLFTGDYGYIDTGGYLYWVGRRDGIVKRHAIRISLAEIENCLHDHPSITLAAAIFEPLKDQIIAFVVLENRLSEETPDAIYQWLQKLLEPHKLPNHIALVSKLPLNPNGKVCRKTLLTQWQARNISSV
jgi:acyl-coenzyme A synthetase/AMP-(fatty) acid ligase